MQGSSYMTAAEAARELGISMATLYSYVSRGMVRSEEVGTGSRARRYNREDVEKLKQRKEQRRNPAAAVEQALHWGAPVLESTLTLIEGGRLYYRGRDAAHLASTASFEQVAGLLWTGELEAGLPRPFIQAGARPSQNRMRPRAGTAAPPHLADLFQTVLAGAAAKDPARYDLRPGAVQVSGAHILHLLTAVAASGRPVQSVTRKQPERSAAESKDAGIAQILQAAWAPSLGGAARLFNAALVLCADHELNISSFTARCVASAGATPYGVVIAGLAALQGFKHGGHTARAGALLTEVGEPARAGEVLAARLRRGEGIPGFGHPLYPDGDPRGRLLLEITAELLPDAPVVRLGAAVEQAAFELIGERPTIDLALAVLAAGLALPEGGALALFALGRTAGWIAHALEQYETDQLIRPRARYVGPPPGSDD